MGRSLNVGELAQTDVRRKPNLRLAEIETHMCKRSCWPKPGGRSGSGWWARHVPATPDGSAERATVTAINHVLGAGSGTLVVRLELPNKGTKLLAGVRCKPSFAAVKLTSPNTAAEPLRETPKPRASKASIGK